MNCKQAEYAMQKRLDGDISPAELSALESHIKCCPDCAAKWERYQNMQALFAQVPDVEIPPNLSAMVARAPDKQPMKVRRRFMPQKAALAAAALCILLIGTAGGIALNSGGAKSDNAFAVLEKYSMPAAEPMEEIECDSAPEEPQAVMEESGTVESCTEETFYVCAEAETAGETNDFNDAKGDVEAAGDTTVPLEEPQSAPVLYADDTEEVMPEDAAEQPLPEETADGAASQETVDSVQSEEVQHSVTTNGAGQADGMAQQQAKKAGKVWLFVGIGGAAAAVVIFMVLLLRKRK